LIAQSKDNIEMAKLRQQNEELAANIQSLENE